MIAVIFEFTAEPARRQEQAPADSLIFHSKAHG